MAELTLKTHLPRTALTLAWLEGKKVINPTQTSQIALSLSLLLRRSFSRMLAVHTVTKFKFLSKNPKPSFLYKNVNKQLKCKQKVKINFLEQEKEFCRSVHHSGLHYEHILQSHQCKSKNNQKIRQAESRRTAESWAELKKDELEKKFLVRKPEKWCRFALGTSSSSYHNGWKSLRKVSFWKL